MIFCESAIRAARMSGIGTAMMAMSVLLAGMSELPEPDGVV
jgi:hypothetical protein